MVDRSAPKVGFAVSPQNDIRVVKKIGSRVKRVSRYVPGATCLTQALAAHVLINLSGHSSKLQIGVVKEDDGELKAHAWLESCGKVIVGNHKDLANYAVLNYLKGNNP